MGSLALIAIVLFWVLVAVGPLLYRRRQQQRLDANPPPESEAQHWIDQLEQLSVSKLEKRVMRKARRKGSLTRWGRALASASETWPELEARLASHPTSREVWDKITPVMRRGYFLNVHDGPLRRVAVVRRNRTRIALAEARRYQRRR